MEWIKFALYIRIYFHWKIILIIKMMNGIVFMIIHLFIPTGLSFVVGV